MPVSVPHPRSIIDDAGLSATAGETDVFLENWQWLGLLIAIFLGLVVSRTITVLIRFIIQLRLFARAKMELSPELTASDFIRPIRIAVAAWFWLLVLTTLGLPDTVSAATCTWPHSPLP